MDSKAENTAVRCAATVRTDEMPISEAVRGVIGEKLAAIRADKGFQERLQRRLAEDREVLESLAL